MQVMQFIRQLAVVICKVSEMLPIIINLCQSLPKTLMERSSLISIKTFVDFGIQILEFLNHLANVVQDKVVARGGITSQFC